MRISVAIEFPYGHRLASPYPQDGRCANLHGHSARVEFVFEGEPAPDGMVIDFTIVKARLRDWIDRHFDHAMLLNARDEDLYDICITHKWKQYRVDSNPTAETLARTLYNVARDFGFPIKSVRFYESSTTWADCDA